jgi:hypothetical protein
MRTNTTVVGSGTQGNNVAANTAVASCVNVPVGRYRMTGSGRHTLADGLKVTGIPSPVGTVVIPGGPGDTIAFPVIVFDLPAVTTINVSLNQATGASDTASAVICLESINH